MNKKKSIAFATFGLILLACGCGAGSSESRTGILIASDIRAALQALPYRFELRRIKGPAGNTDSFVGKAHGPHHTTMEFSIGLGSPPHPIPVPGAGTKHVVWYEEMGFVWNDDEEIGWKFETAAQWQEVPQMAAKVNGSLCRAATGKPCPI